MEFFRKNQYWALILGGSSGIGLASARKLAEEGIHLCIIHRDRRVALPGIQASFEDIRAKGVKIETFNINALLPEGRQQVLKELVALLGNKGKIRLLLHAIARGNLKPLIPESINQLSLSSYQFLREEDFQLTIQAMAVSLLSWTHDLLHAGLFAPDARIVGLTSEGNKRAWRGYAAVSAAKAALEALTRSMALELAPFGIRTNVIQAGITDTPSLRMIPGSEQLKAAAQQRNPFRRLTTPEDVADVIFLLATEEAAWINGAVIPVDGGEHIT